MSKNTVRFEGAFTHDTRRIINENFDDNSLCTTQLDVTSSTTLVNVPGMVTGNLVPGTYKFVIHIAGTSNASGGLKAALKFGTAAMLTSIEATARAYTASAVAVSHTTTATDAASLVASTSAVIDCVIQGTLVIATTGTLQLQVAQNASNGAATSVYVGSYMEFGRIV